MVKLKLLISIGVFLVVLGVYGLDTVKSLDFQKKQESLPLIISVQQFPYRIGGTVEEYEHLLKYYGVNEIYFSRHDFFSPDKSPYPKLIKEMRKHGFYTTMFQGGGLGQPESFLPLPKAVDAEGNEYKGGEGFSIDRIDSRMYTDYIQPLIDNTVKGGCEIIRICEYGLYNPTYSVDNIKQFRKDLMEQDEGIDWIFYDGHIEHIKFWRYARAQLGIEKENYAPDNIGEFPSYKEYLPADIGKNREDTRDLTKYLPQPGDEKYRKNLHLFWAFQRYEFFKHCQKWYKYAKEKGIKYCVAGPVPGPSQFSSEIPHDPYVDYVGARGGAAVIFGLIPGATSHFIDPPARANSVASLYVKKGYRYLRLMNEFLGKGTYLSTETVSPLRLPIGFYRPSFSGHLVNNAIHKSKFLMMEFPVTEAVFDTGLPYSIRQYNLSVLDAYRQVTASGLNKGRILKSNWLVETSDLSFPFGADSRWYNYGDMRSELYLNEGYIPDVDQSQGEDRIPLENYKVITMGGAHFSSIVIDQLKEWVEKASGRTLFTNYLFFSRSLYNGLIEGERYVNLGIWNTPDIREYRIKEVTWVDEDILPDVELDNYYPLRASAALPEGNAFDALPPNAQVVMKGITEEGKEVPLVVIIQKGENRIINIVFGGYPDETFTYQTTYCGFTKTASNKDLFDLMRNTMFNLFSYIQKEDNFFITRIKTPFPMDVVFRAPVLDEKGIVTLAAVGCVTLGEENGKVINPVVLEYEKHKVVSKIDDRSMVIASLDGSALASCSSIEIDGTIYVKEVFPETLYVLSAIDNKSYHNSKLFHLWTYEPARIKFLKPKTWTNEEKIKVYNFDRTAAIEVPFKIKNEYIELETEGDRAKDGFVATGGSEYKISYGKIEDSLWKEFCKRLSVKEELRKDRFDDSAWKNVNITTSSDPAPYPSGTDGWYRVHFNVPEAWKGESLILELGKHYTWNSAWVYFNGENQISEDWHGWEHVSFPRTAIISKKIIKYGEDNVISVRIGNAAGRNGIRGGPIRLINPAKGEVIDLSMLDWLYKEEGNRSWSAY